MAQTRPGLISALLSAITVGCAVASHFWSPLQWVNRHASELSRSDGAAVSIGIASVAAIGAGFAGVIVAYAISSERPTMVEFRNMVGPLLKANWLSVIGCSFSSAMIALVGATLFAAGAGAWAGWTSIGALVLLLHGAARNIYLFSVLLSVIAIGDGRDKKGDQTVPLHEVITN